MKEQNNLLPEINKLLRTWKIQIEKNEKLHRKKALVLRKYYYALGIPATILSGLFTTSSLATLPQCYSSSLFAICVSESIIGAVATALIGLQTFLQPTERSSDNKGASDRYQTLLRTIDMILITKNKGDPSNILNNIRKTFDDIITTSPVLPVENKLGYALFDRETRNRSQKIQRPLIHSKPATHDELQKINEYDTDDEQEVCIDIDLEDQKKHVYFDTELQYQLERLSDV